MEEKDIWDVLHQESFPIGNDMHEVIGINHTVKDLEKEYSDFLQDDGRLLHLDFSANRFEEFDTGNPLHDLSTDAVKKANLRYWSGADESG